MITLDDTLPVPESLDTSQEFNGVTISRRWFSWQYLPIAVFAVVWDAFLFFWYSTALQSGDTPIIMIVFPLGHVAAGIAITYYVLCGFLNVTRVHLSHQALQVITSPLPWPGNKTVPWDDITSLMVRTRQNKNGQSYQVSYVTTTNREHKLVSGLDHLEQADYIRHQIDHALSQQR